jgi:hypothetical protein
MPILSSPDQASRGGPPSRVGKAIFGTDGFGSALTAIERASTVAELSGVIAEWRNESGLAHPIYHAADVPACNKINPLLLPTYEDDWVKHYVEQDWFRIDPVDQCKRERRALVQMAPRPFA